MRRLCKRFGSRLGRALYLLARPARADHGRGGMAIQTYRGFASHREICLIGRVFRQSTVNPQLRQSRLGRDLADIGRRLLRHGAPGVPLTARFGGAQQRLTTDRDGYFCVDLRPPAAPAADRLWHRLTVETAVGDDDGRVTGAFFVPPAAARFVVISDIDDTVIFTGVANKLKMLWHLFFQGARERVAFPGVAAFYRALHHGRGGDEFNPLLYVSRSPWGLYEILEEFFHLHDIPAGPILFLREWGISRRRPFPRRAREHKLVLIRRMLAVYDTYPFILIGDSGQHDPEIYTRIVREHPGRVLAIYIRHVSGSARERAIQALAAEVVAAGSTLLLTADTRTMAEHAAERGFIRPEAKDTIDKERVRENAAAPVRRVTAVLPRSREALIHADPGVANKKKTSNILIEGDRRKEKEGMADTHPPD